MANTSLMMMAKHGSGWTKRNQRVGLQMSHPLCYTNRMMKMKKQKDIPSGYELDPVWGPINGALRPCKQYTTIAVGKTIEWTSYNAMQRKLNRDADKRRMGKHIWYGEMFIAACLGAALALTIASLV